MAYSSKLFLVFFLAWIMSSMATARPLINNISTLAARLQLDGDQSANCWDSLFELQACTAEVVLFFLNGETNLGSNCCRAIRIIEHECWPAMLGSLGYTVAESDILRGYCDFADSGDTLPQSTPQEGITEIIMKKLVP